MLERQPGYVRWVVNVADRVALRGGVPADPPAMMNVAVVLPVEQPGRSEQHDVSDDAGPPQVPAATAVRRADERKEVGHPPHATEYRTSRPATEAESGAEGPTDVRAGLDGDVLSVAAALGRRQPLQPGFGRGW